MSGIKGTKGNQMKILSIGNSFSQDGVFYLHQIAAAAGFDIETVNLVIGGCSLERHWNNIRSGSKEYAFEVNGRLEKEEPVSLNDVIAGQKWDFVTLQQVSHLAGILPTYHPFIESLFEFVCAGAPGAEIVLHQTWNYPPDSDHSGFVNYGRNPKRMYKAVRKTYKTAARQLGGLRIIPSGDAIYSAAKSGINLYRDGFHMSIIHGRYLLGLVWFRFFTGMDVSAVDFRPDGITPDQEKTIKGIAAKGRR